MKKFTTLILAVSAALIIPACVALMGTSASVSANEPFQSSATISEMVLYDENDVKVTALDLSCNSYYAELNLLIENNSSKDLSFVSGSIGYSINAVNGYMMDSGYINADITAGNKSNETIDFNIAELEVYGISEIADLQIGFDISDDDYNHIYTGPLQIKTSAFEGYDYETDTYLSAVTSNALTDVYGYTVDYFLENNFYSQNGINITSMALLTNTNGEKAVFLEAENTSDTIIDGSISDIAVNDLIICGSTWTTSSILPGARKIFSLSIYSMLDQSCLSAVGINDIGSFSLSFTLRDSDYNILASANDVSVTSNESSVEFDRSGEELYNENGIRIVSKGLVLDDSSYSNKVHLLLMIENNSEGFINIDDDYGSLSVNGYMCSCIAYSSDVPAGMSAVMDIEIQSSSLEKNNISDISEISNAELGLKIKSENYSTIAEPKISVNF